MYWTELYHSQQPRRSAVLRQQGSHSPPGALLVKLEVHPHLSALIALTPAQRHLPGRGGDPCMVDLRGVFARFCVLGTWVSHTHVMLSLPGWHAAAAQRLSDSERSQGAVADDLCDG